MSFLQLIEKGLMFGNLFEVASPQLIDRYNRALKALTGKTTALTEFHVDISGFAPEIGDELGDDLYLNHNGNNRQFILLSTEQKRCPLINSKFSHSRPILRKFIEANEAELFALTAKDAVAGELQNSVFDLSAPERLFDIRRITVEADTTGSMVADAQKLSGLIQTFKTREDAWWDDVLIAEMITLAKTTGDVSRNPITLKPLVVDQGNFWTSHFGGLYVFRDLKHPAAISVGPKETLGSLPIPYLFDLRDRNMIARFLELNDLVEPIVRARDINVAAVLSQKIDFVLIDAAAALGVDLHGTTRRDLRSVAARLGSALPDEFHALVALKRWVDAGGPWPRITSEHPAYFYTLRSRPHADRDLVNQLLAELAPKDIRQLYLCHKELFFDLYKTWPEVKQTFVVEYLEREYQYDESGGRDDEVGHDEPMAEPGLSQDALIDIVGPWGPVRRGRG